MSKRHSNKSFFFDRFLRSTSEILDLVSPLSWLVLLCNYIYSYSPSVFTKKSSESYRPCRADMFNTRRKTQRNNVSECFRLAGIENKLTQKSIINKLRLLPRIHSNSWLNTFFGVATSMKKNDKILYGMIDVLENGSNKQIFDYIKSVIEILGDGYKPGLSDSFNTQETLMQLEFRNSSKATQSDQSKPLIFKII